MFFIRFVFKRPKFLAQSLQKVKSEVSYCFLNGITKAKMSKELTSKSYHGTVDTFDVKDVIHNIREYHTLFDIDIDFCKRTLRVLIEEELLIDWQ